VKLRSKAGFTLFEIIISMSIVGLIIGLVVGGMSDYLDWDMKKASNKMAATVRYVYNKSATEGLYIRLIIDINERAYWVEATTDPVLVAKEDMESSKGKRKDKKDEEDEEEKTKDGEIPKLKPAEPQFGQVDSFLLKPSKLPKNIYFKDVSVEHLTFPVDSGKVAIFFFPNGYVENAVINLRDEDDEVVYSIKTNPISGRVSIEAGYRNLEEE
jgi:general secretion pathway protein H